MKTSELTGAALDWAVAKCEGRITGFNLGGGLQVRGRTEEGEKLPDDLYLWYGWHPSNDWSQGGPLIEKHKLTVTYCDNPEWGQMWIATTQLPQARFDEETGRYFPDGACGQTALMAAMRCVVNIVLGDEVELPEELK